MILVTSATGTIGSEVVKTLKAQGQVLKAASRDPANAQDKLGVPTVSWDWKRPQDFVKTLGGVRTLFLGTPPGIPEEKDYGLSAVAAAKQAGVKKIVKLSAIGTENMPDSPHRQVELAIEQGGFQWVFLRPNFFMQNLNENMLMEIKQYGSLSVPTGEGLTSAIDARDIAAVAAVGMIGDSLNGQGLTLTGSEALSYKDMAEQLGLAIGKTLRHVDIPAPDYKVLLLKAGVSPFYADFLTMLYHEVVRKGYVAGISDAVKKTTGREPIRFSQYAKDYADAFKG
ncbi:MAG: SDR family oxidoreductase [bacterium]